jgi:hypothetical protein
MASLGLTGRSVLKCNLLNPDIPKLIIQIMKLCTSAHNVMYGISHVTQYFNYNNMEVTSHSSPYV